MNKYKLNILISILSVIAILMIYFLERDSMTFILAMVFVGAYYMGKNNINNKVIKKILELISASLFLMVAVISIFFIITVIVNIDTLFEDILDGAFNNLFMIVCIYFLFRIGIDSYKYYRDKEFNFAVWLKVITLVVIDMVMLRLLFSKCFFGLEDTYSIVGQNGIYFFAMLSACMISSIDFSKKIKITLEGIAKLLIAIIVSLSVISVIDTLNIYVTSDEYQPIICFYETHSDDKTTYYSFGYSITYHYGDEAKAEYRLFNLIPFYKK